MKQNFKNKFLLICIILFYLLSAQVYSFIHLHYGETGFKTSIHPVQDYHGQQENNKHHDHHSEDKHFVGYWEYTHQNFKLSFIHPFDYFTILDTSVFFVLNYCDKVIYRPLKVKQILLVLLNPSRSPPFTA
jgi:hypothetical protein